MLTDNQLLRESIVSKKLNLRKSLFFRFDDVSYADNLVNPCAKSHVLRHLAFFIILKKNINIVNSSHFHYVVKKNTYTTAQSSFYKPPSTSMHYNHIAVVHILMHGNLYLCKDLFLYSSSLNRSILKFPGNSKSTTQTFGNRRLLS